MRDQRGIAHLLLIILLVGGIAVAVYLLQFSQVFKPKADDSGEQGNPITFTNFGSDRNDEGAGAAGFSINGLDSGPQSQNEGESGATGFYIDIDSNGNVSLDADRDGSGPTGSVSDGSNANDTDTHIDNNTGVDDNGNDNQNTNTVNSAPSE